MLSGGVGPQTLDSQIGWFGQHTADVESHASADPARALELINDLAAAVAAAAERIGQLDNLTRLDTRNPANRPTIRQPQRSRGATRVLAAAAA